MSVKYAPSKLRVPSGFQNILEGLAREILREQPENIIQFAANYFRDQLKERSEVNNGEEPLKAQLLSESKEEDKDVGKEIEDLKETASDETVDNERTSGVGEENGDKAEAGGEEKNDEVATIGEEKNDDLDTVAGEKNDGGDTGVGEKNGEGDTIGEENKDEAKSGEEEQKDDGVTAVEEGEDDNIQSGISSVPTEEEIKAATKIQASFRGSKVRASLKEPSKDNDETKDVGGGEGKSDMIASENEGDKGDVDQPLEDNIEEKRDVLVTGENDANENKVGEENSNISEVNPDANNGDDNAKSEAVVESHSKEEEAAAIKIQSLLRGNKARKEVEELKSSSENAALETTDNAPETRDGDPAT